MTALHKITPCLWFDGQAEQAAQFYVSIFKNSGIDAVSRFGREGFEIHGRAEGSVMTVAFHLEDHAFTALNGGPQFKFNEAISLQVYCETQDELNHFWNQLTQGGQEGRCGWLKDKFGLSWQIVPATLPQMACDPDAGKAQRLMRAMLQMGRLEMAELERAFRGNSGARRKLCFSSATATGFAGTSISTESRCLRRLCSDGAQTQGRVSSTCARRHDMKDERQPKTRDHQTRGLIDARSLAKVQSTSRPGAGFSRY